MAAVKVRRTSRMAYTHSAAADGDAEYRKLRDDEAGPPSSLETEVKAATRM